jgi:hypothetical protein
MRGDPVDDSPECEHEGLDPRIEKLDLELSVLDRLRLPDQLIYPLFGDRAITLVINIDSVSGRRQLSVNEYAKPHGRSRP